MTMSSSLLATLLADRSGLTVPQVNTMILQQRVRNGELSAKQAASKRLPKPVAVGAYYRVLSQAKSSVRESVYTLLLCEKLGILSAADLKRLIDLVSKVPDDVEPRQSSEVMSLVESLVKKMVTL